MRFRVLKQFRGNGQDFPRGAEVDIEPSPKVQGLIDQRYLLPIDAAVAQASPAAEIAESPKVTRRGPGRPAKTPTPAPEGSAQ